jgi:elongation factor G
MTSLTKRKGNIYKTESKGGIFSMQAIVPLSQMFGFASELRGQSQGQGEYSMEYKTHQPVSPDEVAKIIKDVKTRRKALS